VLKDHRDLVLTVAANLLGQNVTVLVLASVLTGCADLVECLSIADADINEGRTDASDKRLRVMFETFGHSGGLWIVLCGGRSYAILGISLG